MTAGNIILLVLMASVALVLVVGVIFMARGGEANRKYSNKMMVLRVTLQGLALVLLGVLALFRG